MCYKPGTWGLTAALAPLCLEPEIFPGKGAAVIKEEKQVYGQMPGGASFQVTVTSAWGKAGRNSGSRMGSMGRYERCVVKRERGEGPGAGDRSELSWVTAMPRG